MFKAYLIRGSLWAFAGKFITALMGLTLYVLLARILTPNELGVYFLAFNLATFFAILARMGLENTLLRFVAEAYGLDRIGRTKELIRKGLLLAAVNALSVAMLVISGIGNWLAIKLFNSPQLDFTIGFVAIWTVLLAFQHLFGEVFRAFQDIRNASLYGSVFTSVATVSILALSKLLHENITLEEILQWVMIAGSLNIIFAATVLLRKLTHLPVYDEESSVSHLNLIQHSWPLLFNTLTLFVLIQSDIWVLGVYGTESDVAVYGAASRLVLLTGMSLNIVNAVVPPLIARLHAQNDMQKLELLLRTVGSLAAVPAFIILFTFICWGEWVMDTVFGDYYYSGGTILAILSLGQAINVFVGSCGYTLVMTGQSNIMMWISIISATIALSSGLILVHEYGPIGIAIGYASAMAFQQLAMLFFTRLRCGIWTHAGLSYLIKPLNKIKNTMGY